MYSVEKCLGRVEGKLEFVADEVKEINRKLDTHYEKMEEMTMDHLVCLKDRVAMEKELEAKINGHLKNHRIMSPKTMAAMVVLVATVASAIFKVAFNL